MLNKLNNVNTLHNDSMNISEQIYCLGALTKQIFRFQRAQAQNAEETRSDSISCLFHFVAMFLCIKNKIEKANIKYRNHHSFGQVRN